MKKKSQTEIMGLAIIIILIIVGATFVIRFIISKEPADYKKDFTHAELAINMINTFLETTSESCKKLSMTELLQDCGATSGISINCGCIDPRMDYCECPDPDTSIPSGAVPPEKCDVLGAIPPNPTLEDVGIMSSCDYVEETAKKIFKDTLDAWGTDYVFKAVSEEDTLIDLYSQDLIDLGKEECPGNKKSKLFPIPITSGTETKILSVKLDICE
jgi:hypothetical protein